MDRCHRAAPAARDFPDAGRFEVAHVYVVPHGLETIEVVDETGTQLTKAKWLLSPIPAWYLASDRFWRSRAALVVHLRRINY